MSIGDIIGSATKKLRPRRKDNTRTVVLASAGIASALWAAMKLKKELYEIIANHSGQPNDKVWADSDRDYWMRAGEAKEYGMIDEVLIRTPKKD